MPKYVFQQKLEVRDLKVGHYIRYRGEVCRVDAVHETLPPPFNRRHMFTLEHPVIGRISADLFEGETIFLLTPSEYASKVMYVADNTTFGWMSQIAAAQDAGA